MIFDNLIWHSYYSTIQNDTVSTLDFVFLLNLENWMYPTHCFSHALLPYSYLFDSESARRFCKILLKEVCMLDKVTNLEKRKHFHVPSGCSG